MPAAAFAVAVSTFVALSGVAPSVKQEMRYAGSRNFLGRPVAGYEAPKCLLVPKAADALALAQKDLEALGLSLRVYDCFRPQRAVDDFVAWAKGNKERQDLFAKGYIAAKSGHSRGATVDLTIDGLDMGTPFDAFDERSHAASLRVSRQARANRLLLKSLMEKRGFRGLSEEWWHFTLVDEPFPNTYFDEPVR